jgi:hypothetical protein
MHLRRSMLAAGTAAAFVLSQAAVSAHPLLATVPVQTSGPSPFAACEVGGPGTVYPNTEVEPWVAVNPTDHNNIIGVYQQDRWSNGGAHGLVAAVSFDGGTSWTQTWAHFSTCSGGTPANGGDYDRASDPWVTFSPNGVAHQISLSVSADQLTSAILVSKSADGGATWSEPTTLIRETSAFNFNDKESITADPTDSDYVYAVWDRSRKPGENASFNALHSYAFRGDPTFSRTTDGGATWEPPRKIFGSNKNLWTIGNQIVVLPDGTLVDVFELFHGSGVQGSVNAYTESLIRSTDKGETWSKPIDISTDQSVATRDPDTGAAVRSGAGLPDIAVDWATGALYVVWSDSRFSGGAYNDVALSVSRDGGLSWSDPVKVNKTPAGVAAFTPSVEVAADGTVGVTYYDFRSNTPSAGVPTDYWLVHCQANCDTAAGWASHPETHVDGGFNIEAAPIARGYFLGDYAGLATIGGDFLAFYSTTNGDAANAFASRIP